MSVGQGPELRGGIAARTRWLFPTASRIMPTSVNSQALVEPGFAEPLDLNLSWLRGVRFNATGRLRQNATMDPSITVRAEDLGSIGIDIDRLIYEALNGSDITSDDLTRLSQLAQRNRATRSQIGVARCSIKRENYDQIPGNADGTQIGVRATWERWPAAGSQVTPGDIVRGTAPMLEDAAGNLLKFFVTSDGAFENAKLHVYYYAPASFLGWQVFTTVDLNALFPDFSPLCVAPVRRGSSLYLCIAGSDPAKRRVVIAQLRGATPAIAEVSNVSNGFDLGAATGLPVRISACDTAGGMLVAVREDGVNIRMARSDDMRTWDAVDGDSALVRFGDFMVAAAVNGQVLDIQTDAEGTDEWSCTFDGEILRSRDDGRSVSALSPPTLAALNLTGMPLALRSVSVLDNAVVAVGDGGLIIRSKNAGQTWEVIRYPRRPTVTTFKVGTAIVTNAETAKDVPARSLYKVKLFKDGGGIVKCFISGGGGLILYSANVATAALPTFATILDHKSTGAYVDFVCDNAVSGNTLLAVGSLGVHQVDAIAEADRRKRAVLINDAEDAGAAAPTYFLAPDEQDIASLNAIAVEGVFPVLTDAATRGYVLTGRGVVHRFVGNGAGSVTFELIASLSPSDAHYSDIDCPDGSVGEVVISMSRGQMGSVWTSVTADDPTPVFYSQMAPKPINCLRYASTTVGSLGGHGVMMHVMTANTEREFVALHPTADGGALFATYNKNLRAMEVYLGPRPAASSFPMFRLVDSAVGISAGANPSFTTLPDGSYLLALGKSHRIGIAGGAQWVGPQDPATMLPIDEDNPIEGDYLDSFKSVKGAREVCWYRGRIFSSAPTDTQDKVATWVTWDWDAAGSYFMPIIAGKPIWLGVDDALGLFAGDPQPGDAWLVPPRFVYGKQRLVIESAELGMRSKNDEIDGLILTYDRTHPDAVLGLKGQTGTHWRVTGFAIFGCNFMTIEFWVSDPSNPAEFTKKFLSNILYTAPDPTLVHGPGGVETTNVIVIDGAELEAGMFAPGRRQFFAEIALQHVRLKGNSENAIFLDRAITLPPSPDARSVNIYGDRHIWLGENRSLGPASVDGLIGTDYQFCRIAKVVVPPQSTADGHIQCGYPIIGAEELPDADGRGFGFGFSWEPKANTVEDKGNTGIGAVTHYGRTESSWAFSYQAESIAALVRRLAPFLRGVRVPFAWIVNGDDPINSGELMRLRDTPKYTNLKGNKFRSDWIVDEVP